MYIRYFALALAMLLSSASVFADSETQKAFERLKALEGNWDSYHEGHLVRTHIRTMSRGNSIMHEMAPTHMPDNPITMFYAEEDRLYLRHYCDAGNRPTMTGKMSEDGNVLEFKFNDVAGVADGQRGYMSNLVITILDENHYTEDWTLTLLGDKGGEMLLHRDNKRAK